MKEKTGNISRGKLQKLISEKMKYKKRVRVMQLTYDDLADIKGISRLQLRKDLRAKKFDPRVPKSIGDYIKLGIQPEKQSEIKIETVKTEVPKKQEILKEVPTEKPSKKYNIDMYLSMAETKGSKKPGAKALSIIQCIWNLADNFEHPKEERVKLLAVVGKLVKLTIPPEHMETALQGKIHPSWVDLGVGNKEYSELYNKRYPS